MTRDRERMRELGRKGGQASGIARQPKRGPVAPYAGTFGAFLELAGLAGASRAATRAMWKAVDGEPLTADELAIYQRHTGRTTAPTAPVRELVLIAGRRGGKTQGFAARTVWQGIRRDYRALLAKGETAILPLIASDKEQAAIALAYVKAFLELPALRPYVARIRKASVELRTGCIIRVATCSYKAVRGPAIPLAVGDETAFWHTDDGSASPDAEVLTALRPGLASVPGSLLLMGSTPYARAGALWKASEKSYGQDDPRVLVWNADTLSMNPTFDAGEVAQAFEDDPAAAAAEYGDHATGHVTFRSDVQTFLDPDVVRDAIEAGCHERAPLAGQAAVAFVDPSGGASDSFTLAIAHTEGERAVLDCVREARVPFSPDAVCKDFAAVAKSYGLASVTGDHYAGEWPRERFAVHGITYQPSERSKSDLYRELLPLMNSGRVALLDVPRLKAQLTALERRVARGGRDSVDHPPNGKDDVANAAAGALVLAAQAAGVAGVSLTAEQTEALGALNTSLERVSPLAGMGDGQRSNDAEGEAGMSDEECAWRGQHSGEV